MAKEKITINGRDYKAKELDFNFVCELGENGIDIADIGKKILPTVRVYVAYCMGVDAEIAGMEINEHIVNGGDFNEFTETFNEKAESSDFFQALSKRQADKTENPKRTTKKSEKTGV